MPCADSVALARSAALTCAAADWLSTCRRIRPHTSNVQLAEPSALYVVVAAPPLEEKLLKPPAPRACRVSPGVTPSVGNRLDCASRISAVAWRKAASAPRTVWLETAICRSNPSSSGS